MRDLLRALRRTCGIAATPCRLCCAVLGAIAIASLFSDSGRSQENSDKLRIATWGGAYAQSQEAAYFGPFTQQTGIAVETETYDGTTAAIKRAIEPDASPLDVVDVSRAALEILCRDGLLEPISPSIIAAAPDGQPPSEDYFAPGLSPCGVASMAWSAAVAYDRPALKTPPTRIADLLDAKRFPGSRALPKSARYTLEFLLLADGVAPGDVYRELSTPEGVDRAFAALDRIKGQVLWWDNAQDPITWLAQKKATMVVGYSGRLFRAVVGARQLNILWDGQIYDVDHWAIPKSAKNKDAARRFIAFASAPDRMAAQAALIAYGPMRRSAVNLVGKHPAIGVDMKRYLPTAPENFANALLFEAGWWTEHGAPLERRFAAWLAQSVADSAGTGSVPEKPQPPAAQPAKPQPKPSSPRR